jgi:hypothetical protein
MVVTFAICMTRKLGRIQCYADRLVSDRVKVNLVSCAIERCGRKQLTRASPHDLISAIIRFEYGWYATPSQKQATQVRA